MSHPQRHFANLLCAHLTGRLTSLVAGQSLFQGVFPDECELGACLVETGGSLSANLTTTQFLTRGADYDASRALAWDIYEELDDAPDPLLVLGTPPDQVKVLRAWALSEPAYLGRDPAGHFLWTLNFRFVLGQKPRK